MSDYSTSVQTLQTETRKLPPLISRNHITCVWRTFDVDEIQDIAKKLHVQDVCEVRAHQKRRTEVIGYMLGGVSEIEGSCPVIGPKKILGPNGRVSNPSISNLSRYGVTKYKGAPFLSVTPTSSGSADQHVTELNEYMQSQPDRLLIGFDTEYQEARVVGRHDFSARRTMFCGSFAYRSMIDGLLYSWMFLSTSDRPCLEDVLAWCAERGGAPCEDGDPDAEARRWKSRPKRLVTAAAHANIVDISGWAGGLRTLQQLTRHQGGSLFGSVRYGMFDMFQHPDYTLCVDYRDTQSLATRTSLAALGAFLHLPKLYMSEADYQDMGAVLDNDPVRFFDYAVRDAEIVVRYLEEGYMSNKRLGVTTPSYSGKLLDREIIRSGWKDSRNNDWVGTYKLPAISKPAADGTWHTSNGWDFSSPRARIIQQLATESYHGGLNLCTQVGWIDEYCYDHDVISAYPTLIGCICDPDMSPEALNDCQIISNVTLTSLDGLHRYGLDAETLWYRPGVVSCRVQFPSDCWLPCIMTVIGDTPVQLLKVPLSTITPVELCMALALGATVDIQDMYLPPLMDQPDDSPSAFARFSKRIIEDRGWCKETYGKHSPQELVQKLLNNAGYGKITQGVRDRTSRDLRTGRLDPLSSSQTTNPLVTAAGTAACRCFLIYAMNKLHDMGYICPSVTTDGFITSAPLDVLNGLDFSFMANRVHELRRYYTGDESARPDVFDSKHEMPCFLNSSTRLNIAPIAGGVNARGSLRAPANTDEERQQLITEVLEASARPDHMHTSTSTEWIDPWTMIQQRCDHMICVVPANVNVGFDFKRRPLPDTVHTVRVPDCYDIPDKYRDVVSYDTKPYDNFEEAEAFRKLSKKRESDLLKVPLGVIPAVTRVRVEHSDMDLVRYCVTAHRGGLAVIPTLNILSGKDRTQWLERFANEKIEDGNMMWKNCGRKTRVRALPQPHIYAEMLQRMGGHML